ncbi:iron ABC transporter ATPase [Amycolatopsis mediterranei S699]|uniref:ATPase component of ABC-type Fe3+-siderophores transport system n=2 Tax=Amycolatopsis mediterranei TaxID=33910 RepID=A0A0H3D2R7_AMYMU|nr:ABC transporter ATP-binding protein [Amycolatopsis mediterranei]ADJ43791.1 ATPase component of ABC-type Fe3+-siderophores transport system [Amycolatopsis mediterranei U32]AEK40502.1 iron ABC transporter ATPase [Amycolatopsis mediterranei S699]AFO75504.1 iron ABC transporter ATPase [Amycolatopsis mediterranei S699]AGT82633.1 iron ABC transporter ATPase [Amycolatopsis mediterranei RB]KDO09200.1 iron ABC transporter ATPase [Amycolatopsis mediterranei]
MTLHTENLELGYGPLRVVKDLSVRIPPGKVTMIVGTNACGKSTLLRGLARLLTPTKGAVYLDGKGITTWRSKDVATVLCLLPQSPAAPEGITVADLVGRGRYPHQGVFRRWSAEDDEAVAKAMLATGTVEPAARPVDELSGAPADILTAELVADVFGLPCRVIEDPVSATPLVVPIGRRRADPREEGTPAAS